MSLTDQRPIRPPWLAPLNLVEPVWEQSRWVYTADGTRVAGGPSNASPRVAVDYPVLQHRPPSWLAQLFAWHDGLGPLVDDRWVRPRLLPAEACVPLHHLMRFGEENILYQPASLLVFAIVPDGALVCDQQGALYQWNQTSHAISEAAPAKQTLIQLARQIFASAGA